MHLAALREARQHLQHLRPQLAVGRGPVPPPEVGQHVQHARRALLRFFLEQRLDRVHELEGALRNAHGADLLEHALGMPAGDRDAGDAPVPAARAGTEHDRHAVRAALLVQRGDRGLEQLLAALEGARVADARAHRVRVVEQEDALHRALAAEHAGEGRALREGAGHRQHQQQHDQHPDREQNQVFQPHTAPVAHGGLEQEVHRRPVHGLEAAPVEDVDDDRDGSEREAAQQRGMDEAQREQAHRRLVLLRTTRARAARNADSVRSSESPVDKST